MIDALLFTAILGFGCLAFAVLGAVADWLDPYGEREDARRRNRR